MQRDRKEGEESVMGELISRQAAIDAVSDLYWMDERLLNFKKEIDKVFDNIKALPSAEPQQWIPIEERPPQFGKDVLVSYRGGVMADWLTQCEGNAYFYISGVAIQDVDAWCELPEPYKGGTE